MRCATSSPTPTPAPCCPCSEQPPAERIFRREGFSVLSFLSGKERGAISVLSFLSEKEKKEPKKRNLNGEGDARKPSGSPPQKRNPNGEGFARKLSGSPPRSFVRVGGGERSFFSFGKRAKEPKKRNPIGEGDERKPSGGRPGLRYPFSPAGLFFQKSPAKYSLQMNARAADGRAQRASPGGFPAFFSGSLFFLRKEKRPEEKPRKIFLRANQAPPTGGRSGPAQAGSRLSFLVLFSFS